MCEKYFFKLRQWFPTWGSGPPEGVARQIWGSQNGSQNRRVEKTFLLLQIMFNCSDVPLIFVLKMYSGRRTFLVEMVTNYFISRGHKPLHCQLKAIVCFCILSVSTGEWKRFGLKIYDFKQTTHAEHENNLATPSCILLRVETYATAL